MTVNKVKGLKKNQRLFIIPHVLSSIVAFLQSERHSKA